VKKVASGDQAGKIKSNAEAKATEQQKAATKVVSGTKANVKGT